MQVFHKGNICNIGVPGIIIYLQYMSRCFTKIWSYEHSKSFYSEFDIIQNNPKLESTKMICIRGCTLVRYENYGNSSQHTPQTSHMCD